MTITMAHLNPLLAILFGAGHFVGLGNYQRLLHDPIFGTSLVNTFEVTLMIVPALTMNYDELGWWIGHEVELKQGSTIDVVFDRPVMID